mgnify:CR=1 FL=1
MPASTPRGILTGSTMRSFDMLTHVDDMSRDQIEAYARKHTVCPFEMALDLSVWMDAVSAIITTSSILTPI